MFEEKHLSDGELFALAVPPAGEPEALPRHLSECLTCSRAFSDWKLAVHELGQEDADAMARRPAREWDALEEKTLSAIRSARIGRRLVSWRWMMAIAASILLCALALPLVKRSVRPAPTAATAVNAELTGQDREDDALLRDVARLTRGDDEAHGLWSSLAPDASEGETLRSEPPGPGGKAAEHS